MRAGWAEYAYSERASRIQVLGDTGRDTGTVFAAICGTRRGNGEIKGENEGTSEEAGKDLVPVRLFPHQREHQGEWQATASLAT